MWVHSQVVDSSLSSSLHAAPTLSDNPCSYPGDPIFSGLVCLIQFVWWIHYDTLFLLLSWVTAWSWRLTLRLCIVLAKMPPIISSYINRFALRCDRYFRIESLMVMVNFWVITISIRNRKNLGKNREHFFRYSLIAPASRNWFLEGLCKCIWPSMWVLMY